MNKHKTKIILLFFSVIQLLSFSTLTISAQNPTFDSLANELSRISSYKRTKAIELLGILYQMANNTPDSSLLLTRCLYEEVMMNYKQGIVDTLLNKKLENRLTQSHLQPFEKSLLQSAFGANLMTEGKYAEAFPIFLQELENFKNFKINVFIARTLHCLGNICNSINLNSLAYSYYSEALNYTSPDFHEYYFIKSNLFVLLSKSNREDAIDSILYLIDLAEKNNREEILYVFYLNVGSLYLNYNPEKALLYFSKLESLDFDDFFTKALLNANKGVICYINNDYIESLYYYKIAQKIMEENNDLLSLSTLYNHVSILFELESQLDSSLYYSRKCQDLNSQLRSNTIAIETHQKYITTLLDAQEKDLLISKQTNELRNRQLIIITVILLLAILLFVIFYQRKRRISIELSAKLNLQQLEQEKQKELLDANIREITSYSTLVSNKNDLLDQIIKMNISMLDNKENILVSVNKINKIIKENINNDDEWENFKLHFDKVHPNFFEKLKQEYSDLTEENLKMCAYINMGMSQKQIAQMLNVVPDSIMKRKYRLKKKFNLTENDSLSEFIRYIAKK